MPDLKEHRPAQATAPARPGLLAKGSTSSDSPEPTVEASGRWGERAASWFRSATDALSRSIAGEPIVERFAELAAAAREPEEVRVELVRLAWKISGAARVELFSDRDGRVARRMTSWPPIIPHETTSEVRSNPRGPIAGPVARSIKDRPAPLVLQLPLKAGDTCFGSLRLTAPDRKPWPARLVRRLTALCSIASTAERGLARPNRGDADPCFDACQGPHGSTILAAFLSFAQAQARRRHEPLSLLEVGVDRLDSIRELLGDTLAESAIERVFRAIKATIRASDVTARLEDGRISVLLPNASAENAQKVAETVRVAIARAGTASTTMPSLTASIGVATYPDHAHDVATLRAAVASTLTRAREEGHDRIAIAIPISGAAAPSLAQKVG
jgi:diguanylate cyclase (GGDEF)-like protein